jgi:hypothetical protein
VKRVRREFGGLRLFPRCGIAVRLEVPDFGTPCGRVREMNPARWK